MDTFTRSWSEFVADLADGFAGGVPTLVFLSLVVAGLIAAAWYFYPAWLPWRWSWSWRRRERAGRTARSTGRFRLGRLRWRLRRKRRKRRLDETSEPDQLPDDVVPDLPAQVLALTADQLAAQGKFAEAVRERLRAMLRDLMERDVLPISPGWTVMELAAAGSRALPELSGPLGAAAGIFSEIWYGLRPATVADDAAMREHSAAVGAIVSRRAAAAPVPAGSGGVA